MKLEVRDKLIELADAHQKADEYRAGRYNFQDGGACAIGCTMRDAKELGLIPKSAKLGDHAECAKINGVPELAWRLLDNCFEGLPELERPALTPRFLRSIKPDADYSNLPARIMARCARKLGEDAPQLKEICETTALLWERRGRGDEPTKSEWTAAEEMADAAWQQADAARQQAYAARQQAYAARQQADAAWQQADAAWQQAYAARQQAYAARQQAYAARQQAYAARQQADAAWQQADAARNTFWQWCADMLCEELAK